MEFDQMLQLIDRVSGSNLDSFVYEQNGIKLKLEKKKQKIQVSRETGSVEMIEAAAPAERPETADKNPEAEMKKIASPLVGVFYTAPAEDAEPFVKPGDRVKKGQVVGIVEAMKLMNEITSDYDGVIRKVCAENSEAVEYGQPLFLVEEA